MGNHTSKKSIMTEGIRQAKGDMVKVLEVCNISSVFPGSFIKELSAIVEARQVKVEFVFPLEARKRDWCKELAEKATVYFVDMKLASLNLKAYVTLFNILKKGDYDIVHSHFGSCDITLKLIKVVFNFTFQLIWHLHGNPLNYKRFWILKLYHQCKYRFFTKGIRLIAINKSDAVFMSRLAKKAEISVLVNGIDVSDLKKIPSVNEYPSFMMLGWLFYCKGDDIVLEACEKLSQKGYRFKMIINGNDTTKQEIERYLRGKWPDYLIFQSPQYDRNDFFKMADVLIVASRSETFNYGIAEASYLGKYIITSDIPGVSWCFHLPNVKIFKSESAEELADWMEDYILHRNEWKFNSDEVRKYIIDSYSSERWVKSLNKIYLSYRI